MIESSPIVPKQNRLEKFASSYRDKPVVWALCISAVLQIAGNVPDFVGTDKISTIWKTVLFVVFVVGVILTIRACYLDAKTQDTLGQQRRKIDHLDQNISELKTSNTLLDEQVQAIPGHIYAITSFHLAKIAQDIGLDSDCRISLFIPTGTGFYLRGRYSQKPTYNYKSTLGYGRLQGIVGMAFDSGFEFENSLPVPNRSGSTYNKDAAKKFSLSEDHVVQWGMKSRLLYARTINDYSGMSAVGVILLESTNQGKFTKEQLDKVFELNYARIRELVLDMFKGLEINPDIARKAGL